MGTTNNILFISHDASRTGAPIELLDLIKWVRDNTNINYKILLRESGELESEFKRIGETYNYTDYVNDTYGLLKLLGDITLIYSNTITNGNLLELFSQLKCPIITHIHEMEFTIRFFGYDNFDKVRKYTTHWIAASEVIKDNLTSNYDINEKNITIVNDFIPSSVFENTNKDVSHIKSEIIKECKIEKECKFIISCGTVDWRKGADLFIQVANIVLNKIKEDNIHFIWIGNSYDKEFINKLKYEIEVLGISKNVHFCGFKDNLRNYLLTAELFLLTSREDPFPLVALLSASALKPIVCFDKATGLSEFLENDSGIIVPFMDVQKMAEKVILLLEDKSLCQKLGLNAFNKLKQNHTVEISAPKILDVIFQMSNKYPVMENRSKLLIELHNTQQKLHYIQQELHNAQQQLCHTQQKLQYEQERLNILLHSETFNVGKLITWFPIKIKYLLKSIFN